MRLQKIKTEYGDKVNIVWKSFPLIPDERPGRRWNDHAAQAWAQAAALGEGASFTPWNPDQDMPASSMPALVAAKCAALQGPEAFARFHLALLKGYFEEGQDISQREVLAKLARAAGLDEARFVADLDSGAQQAAVRAEYEEAQQKGIASVPTVIFADERGAIRVIGVVPTEQYRRLADWLLAT